ncbi:MAG: UDP-N-acetylglucosamine--N-acetylmuramyl-(pentapeptide) pyrophosphoryl-undecaprenol N-acetylglucosamine transferase, partial [Oscillospiraceae bacterium]|nr:UDP-N-acetylglucosamine--N-acetylmuramyl-(pentapeptide) pyrophosphoryl-undecaprenol N-acetylglucosamine transferase [Oscillospiraceae bacterium]
LVSAKQSAEIIDGFKPDAVIGTGGYVCYPVLTQAHKRGIPTLIHESNAVPGLAAKMLSGKVDKVLVAFEGTENLYKKPDRVFLTGTPVRKGFETLSYEQARKRLGLDDKPLVVSFWGSLGASRMNSMMPEFIKRNIDSGAFYHIHATGGSEGNRQRLLDGVKSLGVEAVPEYEDIRAYIDDMPVVMSAADLVLCRAGASTISELTVKGCPAVIVPSPNVAGDHQRKNAQQLEKAGGAVMVEETDCTAQLLYDTVTGLLRDRDRLRAMSESLRGLAVPASAENIAQMILKMC